MANPAATIETNRGTFQIELFEEQVPRTAGNFIELARNADLPLEECDLTAFDLYAADEVFTCSTAGGALAVREIAGRRLPQPCPGPVTERLDRLYWALRESGAHGTPVFD